MNTFELLLTHPLVQRIGWALFHSIWQEAVIAVLLAVVLGLMRKASANALTGLSLVARIRRLASPERTSPGRAAWLPSRLSLLPLVAIGLCMCLVYPTAGTLRTYWPSMSSQSGKPKASYFLSLHDAKINAGLSDAFFRDVFYAGLGVNNADTGESYVFEANPVEEDRAADDEEVVLLDEERVYQLAKAEVAERFPELTVDRLLEDGVDFKEPRPGPVSVTLTILGSEKNLLETPFLVLTAWETLTVSMNQQGEVAPGVGAVHRWTRTKVVMDGEQEAARIEASKKAGHSGQLYEVRWNYAPLWAILDHVKGISGGDVIRDDTVPEVSITLNTDGKVTEAELMELVTVLLKEQRIVLEQTEGSFVVRPL